MTLNNRERMLVVALAIIVFVGVFVQFVLLPQWDKRQALSEQREQLELLIEEINQYNDPQSPVRQAYLALESSILSETVVFFPEIEQEVLILLFNQMFTNAGIDPTSVTFTPVQAAPFESAVAESKIPGDYPLLSLANQYRGVVTMQKSTANLTGGASMEKMEVGIQLQGTYNQIMAFMNEMETNQRIIHLSRISLSAPQGGQLSSNMLIHIYGIPKVAEQDQDLAWSIFDVYGRNNPFQP